jgi:hypothetical protein
MTSLYGQTREGDQPVPQNRLRSGDHGSENAQNRRIEFLKTIQGTPAETLVILITAMLPARRPSMP